MLNENQKKTIYENSDSNIYNTIVYKIIEYLPHFKYLISKYLFKLKYFPGIDRISISPIMGENVHKLWWNVT